MQFFSVQPDVPPPELPVSVQLVSVLEMAPTPELPARAQLFSAQADTPPVVFPVIVQLFSVLELAPYEVLPVIMQLLNMPPEAPPAPLVKVNPDKVASRAKDTHRFDRPPLIRVNSGPLTLRTVRGPEAATGV